jgi:hypothetical protein
MSVPGPGCVKTLSPFLKKMSHRAQVVLGLQLSGFAISMAGAKHESRNRRSERRFSGIEGDLRTSSAYALMASISAPMPMMFMTRFRL